MKKIQLIVSFLMMLTISLVGCTSEEEKGYEAKIYELSDEQTELVTNPSEEYVMASLRQIESITDIEADPEIGEGSIDESKANDCIARIYFSSSLVDQSGFEEDASTLEKGTSAGGSIDIYDNVEDAIARDEYLHGFDENVLLNSGSHAVAGTIVIRTSEKLDKEQQEELTDSIVEILTSGNITEIGVAYADLINMRYDDLSDLLEEKGFTNIKAMPEVIEYDLEKESKCTDITINGMKDFQESDKFNLDDEVIIYYFAGKKAKVPDSSNNLVEKHYEEVEKVFKEAGFTNITTQPHEIDYDENKALEGSVISIEIDQNAAFEADDEFYTNVLVRIDYRVKSEATPEPTAEPVPVPTEEPTAAPVVEESTAAGNEVIPDDVQEASVGATAGGESGETTGGTENVTGGYAVNNKNGKIHIVGKCPATGNGEHAMDEPIYFDSYEKAEAYSVQIKPKEKKRQCGNCW